MLNVVLALRGTCSRPASSSPRTRSALASRAVSPVQTFGLGADADWQAVGVEAVDGIEDLKAAGAQGRFLKHYETATAQAAVSSSTV